MEWRRLLWLSGGLLCTALGCMRSHNAALVPPSRPPEPVAKVAEKPAEKPPEKSSKSGKMGAATLVAVANLRLEAASVPDRTADRKQLAQLAARDYRQALEADPKYLPAHLGLAKSLELSGEPEQALAAYHKALELGPKEAGVWYELGMAQSRMHDYQASLKSLGNAAKLAPENPTIAKALGFTLARVGRFDEGLAWLMRAMNESDAHLNLAKMAQYVGQPQRCQRHLMLAVQLDPSNEEAQQYLAALRGAPAAAGVTQVRHEEAAGSAIAGQ